MNSAEKLYGSRERAQFWLNRPKPRLDGKAESALLEWQPTQCELATRHPLAEREDLLLPYAYRFDFLLMLFIINMLWILIPLFLSFCERKIA
jgi:hypothetical protein